MPEKTKKSSEDGERSSKPSENTQRSSSSRHRSSNPSENGQRRTSSKSGSGNRLTQARETGQSVGQNVENAYNTAMGWLGCERDLNKQILRYNPIFYEFAEKNLLPSYDIQYKASKLLIFLIASGLLQAESVGMLIPEAVTGENGHTTTMIIAGVTIMLFYVGSVGSLAVYVAAWAYLSISTITMLGRRLVKKEESSSQHYKQMTNWHNTMAIWLWRFIISAMEGIHIPGIISAMDLILHYIPTYFLWATGFMFAMLMTKKTEKNHVSDSMTIAC
ncbi:hypothetical protein L204_104399 [Cryptococcus depauperatus]